MAKEPHIDIAVLTIIPEEYQAVYNRLNSPRKAPSSTSDPNLYALVLGEIPNPSSGKAYSILLAMIGRAGNHPSALAAVDTITRWKPRYAFLIGIAGGFELDGLEKGDIVVADLVYGYEYGKLDTGFQPRNNWTYHPDFALVNGAMAFASIHPNWVENIGIDHPTAKSSKVLKGAIASGDKVVDNPNNELFAQVQELWPKLQAVEMEGVGLAAAVEQAQSIGTSVGFLIVRGISDMPRANANAEVRGTEERDLWKVYAANAAAFACSFIADGLPITTTSFL